MIFRLLIAALLCCNSFAFADTLIAVNPSWAELNAQRYFMRQERDTFDDFTAEAIGYGIDLRFAVSEQWAIVLDGTSQKECEEGVIVLCRTDSEYNDINGWYKRYAVGATWNWTFARRYVLELSYRRQHEDYELYDTDCYMWACVVETGGNSSDVRRRDQDNHVPGFTVRGQWGPYELALSGFRALGDESESLWRLENRFLIGEHFNLALAFQLGEDSSDISIGTRVRW